MLPGEDLTRSSPELIQEVEHRMNPYGFDPYFAMYLSQRVNKDFMRDSFFEGDEFFLYYTRHDCPKKNRLHRANRAATLSFLDSRINPETGQGLDVVVANDSVSAFLICNHDGDMFFRDPSQWTTDLGKQRQPEEEPMTSPDDGTESSEAGGKTTTP